jgi:hypothetical protein
MSAPPTILAEAPDAILCCSFSPYPASNSLLAYGTESLLVIGELQLAQQSYTKLKLFQHEHNVVALAWSPLSVRSSSATRFIRRSFQFATCEMGRAWQ